MRIVAVLGLVVPLVLAFGCTGSVIVEGESSGGGGSDLPPPSGGAGACLDVACDGDGTSCSCETQCSGPRLRADCEVTDGDTLICECHYNNGYMGTCGAIGASACSLPGGCCASYLD